MSDPEAWRVPIHDSHKIALVGEAHGASYDHDVENSRRFALYPYPPRSAAGRLLKLLGMTRREYLETFARANVIDGYPGKDFPKRQGRVSAPILARKLVPRPLILLGRNVADAFRFPVPDLMTWCSYTLGDLPGELPIRAAVVPHPSGRNAYYNVEANRAAVRDFILSAAIHAEVGRHD